jgi:hypothetical protein
MTLCTHGHTDPKVVFVISPQGRRQAVSLCGICGAHV